ncbi:hypothetical protein AM500_12730 [Bacillus sp. FJAT-18017]|uniref:DUF3221 domain-containing protein n=1 Tax=Bacillus sp. FJAT-18017 TaxID=1705566 RepID=UPI0006AFE316|nr:DUF3221 domain-containing protein [Bacillus sp. FJAT-18017]ALC90555.1 hypothetical protein AM500_12730 [Bacillus sp. FJAT-18017]
MKRLIIALCFMLVGCNSSGDGSDSEEVGAFDLKGLITEIDQAGNAVLMDDETNGLVWVSVKKPDSMERFQVGQEIVVWTEGAIRESYPAQATALNIEIISTPQSELNHLIASEKTLPDSFSELAFKRKTAPFHQYLVKNADNSSEFKDLWHLYGLETGLPEINFDEEVVLFIGVQESGSCPYTNVESGISAGKKSFNVTLVEPGGNCTADATPRTFVFKVDNDQFMKLESVSITQSGIDTRVPLK